MCLEQDALSRAFGTVANISEILVFALFVLPTTYCVGLLVLSQAFFLYAKMYYDHSATVKNTHQFIQKRIHVP